jgi:hypothetical protein
MTILKTVSTYHKTDGGDVIAELYKSISFLQTTYCFPPESEFYTTANYISPNLDYVEFVIDFHNLESYNKWYELFGEIVEELVVEFIKELKEANVEYQRYLHPDVPINPTDALPLSDFISKFEEVNGVITWKES